MPTKSRVLRLKAIRELRAKGWTAEEIALVCKISLPTYYRDSEELDRLAGKLPRRAAASA
jgi:DNA invertase Pin-like site-specific DNA recombinase